MNVCIDGKLELKSRLFSLSGSIHCCPESFGQLCCFEFYVNKIFSFNFKKWLLCHCEAIKKWSHGRNRFKKGFFSFCLYKAMEERRKPSKYSWFTAVLVYMYI